MNDEASFLRAILASPEDDALKSVYADWLEEHGDPRAGFLRTGTESEPLDRGWVAFMQTLACPFQPGFPDGKPAKLSLRRAVGRRGRLVTFERQFLKESSWSPGLMADLAVLCEPDWGDCAYGPASCTMYPFLCELKATKRPLSHEDIRAALYAGDARCHIHSNFAGQSLFSLCDSDEFGEGSDVMRDETVGTHGVLKRYVEGGRLWYLVVRAASEPRDYLMRLAVGASPHGHRLVGVITHQVDRSHWD